MKFLLIPIFCLLSSVAIALPPDNPIDPAEFQSDLGTGFDVGWAQFPSLMSIYNEQTVIDYAEAGFKNARIRSHFDLNDQLLVHFDSIVTHCLRHGVTPIIAYENEEAEEFPTRENMRKVVAWWRGLAEYFSNHSHKLAFNLFIEVAHTLGDLPVDTLNMWYDSIVPAIRESNPTRILIFAPKGMYPENLMFIDIPSSTGYYYMAEWHDYAGGPTVLMSDSKLHKRWTTGTEIEREQIGISITKANQWSSVSGKPTWMGAWMAGKLADPGYYSPEIEVMFATHMVKEFGKYNIPWSSNAHQHYYDVGSNSWLEEKSLYLDALQGEYQKEESLMKIYEGDDFTGNSKKIEIGYYDSDFMNKYNFEHGFISMSIPSGFVLETFTQPGFSGNPNSYQGEIDNIGTGEIKSFRYTDIRFTEYEQINYESLPEINSLTVYPNPASDFIKLSGFDEEGLIISLFDIRGQLHKTIKTSAENIIYISDLENGMYFLEIINEENSIIKRIIKQ